MYIDVRPLRRSDGSLFIFNFQSEDEFKMLIKEWRLHAVDLSQEGARRWLDILATLESRCDDKYAKDDVVLSSSLFQSEFTSFAYYSSWLLALSTPLEKIKETVEQIEETTTAVAEAAEAMGIDINKDIDQEIIDLFASDGEDFEGPF